MKATVEIFERSTGKVIETQECDDLSAFRRYWTKQCNAAEFGYRLLGGSGKPFERRIVKEADGWHVVDDRCEFLPYGEDTFAQIAEFNGQMTAEEVHRAIDLGQTVYTNFHRYRLEA